jgi:PAS domain S-box-containing protein
VDQKLADILGKIVLIQSTIHVMSDEESMAKFACRGFSRIPCMESVCMFLNGRLYSENWNNPVDMAHCRILFEQLTVPHPAAQRSNHDILIRNFENRFSVHCLTVSTGFSLYGFLFVPSGNREFFSEIRPYVENTLNLIALVIENDAQKKKLLSNTIDLEKLVEERTLELTMANTSMAEEIAERKRMEEMLRRQESLYHDLVESSQDLVWRCDSEGRYIYLNPAWEKTFGYPVEEMIGKKFSDFQDQPVGERDMKVFGHLMKGNSLSGFESVHLGKDGREIYLVFNAKSITDDEGRIIGTRGTAYDITERKKAEAEKNMLQNQLLQAKKMESIGRLAGGVAHDFNNMIMVILGNAEIALEEIEPVHPVRDYLNEILATAIRSADLTRQLLAFARKQTISPRTLDLNDIVSGMTRMLKRLIGENIELVWKPGSELWNVLMDPAQIEQVLVNLSVNARDAIENSGRVTIRTSNVQVDDTFTSSMTNIKPGDYVLLTVSDDGCGIDREHLPHLFEPFFTTKELGKGTGLGLATVYGIIEQNKGYIDVDGEKGKGAVFRIYFPRHASLKPVIEDKDKERPARGDETILFVEDEMPILNLGKTILERYGYTVLTSNTPEKSLEILENHAGPVQLLITDVVMPGMNGKNLSEIVKEKRPGIKILFISGYTADVVARHGVVEKDIHLLEKPFTVKTLVSKTREVLDAKVPDEIRQEDLC